MRQAGFTLIEILVGLVVLGLLVIALSQGVRTGFALWDAQARRVGETEELDATQRTLRTLLTGIPVLPVSASDVAASAIAIKGEADRITFVGDLPSGLGAKQLADIVLEQRGGRLLLGWAPHLHEKTLAPAAPTETELTRGVEALDFAYFGIASRGQMAHWQAQWGGPTLPLLIRVRLRFAAGDGRRWPNLIAAPQLAAP
jgi:general secretion pathway protein J